MKYINRIDELYKSKSYLDRTATIYSETGDIKLSRFVEYNPSKGFTQGWELMGFWEVDNEGEEIGNRYIKLKDFIYDNDIEDIHTIKSCISAALGEMSNAAWIEEFKFTGNKAYATIYLGKLGMIIEDKIYAPVLKYPSNREGDTFWISATNERGNFIAKTVIVTKSDISNNELEHNAIAIQNSAYRWAWEEETKERRKGGLMPKTREPKTVDERAFVASHEVVRDTGEKGFFIIYVQGSKYPPITFARKAAGANIELVMPRTATLISDMDLKRARNKKNNEYNLHETEKRMKIFYYYNKTLKKWEPYLLERVIKTKDTVQYKELEVRKGVNTIRLKIYKGDYLRIPKTKGDKIELYEMEVLRIDPKDDKKLTLKPLEKSPEIIKAEAPKAEAPKPEPEQQVEIPKQSKKWGLYKSKEEMDAYTREMLLKKKQLKDEKDERVFKNKIIKFGKGRGVINDKKSYFSSYLKEHLPQNLLNNKFLDAEINKLFPHFVVKLTTNKLEEALSMLIKRLENKK